MNATVNAAPAASAANTAPVVKTAPVQPKVDTAKVEAAPIPKHKVKINGREVEKPLDEILSNYGHHAAAEEKFMEAAEQRKQNIAFLEKMKASGIDPEKWQDPKYQEQWLQEQFQKRTKAQLEALNKKKLTPEQLKQLEKDEKLTKYETAEKAKKDAEDQTLSEAKHAAAREALTNVINVALKKANLPETLANQQLVAQALQHQNANEDDVIGGNVDLYRVVAKMKDNHFANQKAYTNNLDPDTLAERFTEEELAPFLKAYAKRKNIALKPKDNTKEVNDKKIAESEQARYNRLSPMEKQIHDKRNKKK